ncbi:MAG: hypothetical protein KC547_05965 [Anaerolineae bacterium]|nr:hypothetical protein [Anaerolineae bacterium]
MPARMEIEENGRVLHYIATDPWTIDQMLDLVQQANKIYEQADFRVHTLIDMTRTRSLPQGIMRARANSSFTHPRAGQMVIIGANMLVKTISNVVAKLASFDRIVFLDTEEKAWEYLRSVIEQEQLTQ